MVSILCLLLVCFVMLKLIFLKLYGVIMQINDVYLWNIAWCFGSCTKKLLSLANQHICYLTHRVCDVSRTHTFLLTSHHAAQQISSTASLWSDWNLAPCSQHLLTPHYSSAPGNYLTLWLCMLNFLNLHCKIVFNCWAMNFIPHSIFSIYFKLSNTSYLCAITFLISSL